MTDSEKIEYIRARLGTYSSGDGKAVWRIEERNHEFVYGWEKHPTVGYNFEHYAKMKRSLDDVLRCVKAYGTPELTHRYMSHIYTPTVSILTNNHSDAIKFCKWLESSS